MIRVVQPPAITFKCDSCGATCQADPDDFTERHTMPPTWLVTCAFCRMTVVCSPSALIARLVGGTVSITAAGEASRDVMLLPDGRELLLRR